MDRTREPFAACKWSWEDTLGMGKGRSSILQCTDVHRSDSKAQLRVTLHKDLAHATTCSCSAQHCGSSFCHVFEVLERSLPPQNTAYLSQSEPPKPPKQRSFHSSTFPPTLLHLVAANSIIFHTKV